MRILWIGKESASGDAGDEVFDRKTIAALRSRGHTVVTVYPPRVGRLRELFNLARGTAHYRSWFDSPANRQLCLQAGTGYDVTICSWEPLDVLVPHLRQPVIVIAHNVSSLALVALFPDRRLVKLAARRASSWEGHLYQRGKVAAVAALSRQDQAHLAGLAGAPETILTVPGMPPIVPLAADARLRKELVLLGTYDWVPKRRDVIRFMQEYAGLPERFPLFAGVLPSTATAAVAIAGPVDHVDHGAAIRFGLITDRFEAGHKLKTLAYIAQNQVVLSFTDVTLDFADIPDHAFFLRQLASTADIGAHIAEVAALDADTLRARFLAFQRRCAEVFTWDAVAARLMKVADEASGCGGRQPADP